MHVKKWWALCVECQWFFSFVESTRRELRAYFGRRRKRRRRRHCE